MVFPAKRHIFRGKKGIRAMTVLKKKNWHRPFFLAISDDYTLILEEMSKARVKFFFELELDL
jgi:hypothetical protein